MSVSMTTDHFFQRALEHQQGGRLNEAQTLYRAIIELQPDHPGANYQLGLVALQVAQPQAALPYLRRALEADPGADNHWLTYAAALRAAGQPDPAEAILALAQARGVNCSSIDDGARQTHAPSDRHVQDALLATTDQPDPNNRPPVQPAGQSEGADAAPFSERQALHDLFQAQDFTEAETVALGLIRRYPRDAFIWKVYGSLLAQTKRPEAALDAVQTALSLNPRDPELHNTLGVVLKSLDRFGEALNAYQQALSLNPDYVEVHFNLGNLFKHLGQISEAESCYRQAIAIKGNDERFHAALGMLLMQAIRLQEAETVYRQALAINPESIEINNNIANILMRQGRLSEAEASFRDVLARKPDFAEVWNNIGNVLWGLGRFAEADNSYRQALSLQPQNQGAYSNRLFGSAYGNLEDPQWIRRRSEGWEHAMLSEQEREAARTRRFDLAPRTNRPLRLGVLSADFGQHAVAYFLLSWMRHLDPSRVELLLYPTKIRHDSQAELFKALNVPWTPVHDLSDSEAAARIRADQVDILVDTSGHTAGHRLGIIAHRAAPVQCHYIGYFATTGLSEMDYFIADETLIPPALDEQFTEQVWRLPHPWMVYAPLEEAPEPCWRADADETLWVGSFNNLIKVREDCLVLWAQVLRTLPQARLLLKDVRGKDPVIRERICAVLAREGIDLERVTFADAIASWAEHMAQYKRLDIALDPIPMTGGSTAFDALWMGVPLVTLAGDRLIGRQGAAALMGLGRPEWIARDVEDYVRIVVELAQDVRGRRAIRMTQREQMRQSPLCDGAGMARALEAAFEQMFDRWQEKQNILTKNSDAFHVIEKKAPTKYAKIIKSKTLDSSGHIGWMAHKQQELMLLFNEKRFQEAEDPACNLTKIYPQSAFAWKIYGSILSKLDRTEEALKALMHARSLNPSDHEINNALSVVLSALGRNTEAVEYCRQSIALNPEYALAHNNLGNLLKKIGDFFESEKSYRRALDLNPNYALVHMNLGSVLQEIGELSEAENHCRKALEIDSNSPESHSALGQFLFNLGRLDEAEDCYLRAIAINPGFADAYRNLGTIAHLCGHLTEAENYYRQAINLKPDLTHAHANLGAALAELERLPESESSYLKALEIKPDDQASRDSFLFEFAYSGYYSPDHFRALSRDWEHAMLTEQERAAARTRRFDLAPRINRPLRIGVLSADFGLHAVAYFLLSWMRNLNPSRVELRLYPTKIRHDDKAECFRALNAPWIPMHGLPVDEAAARIRADKVDILVDTNGHTAGNRLGIIAHRAAPVQCHYIGYFATTGLSEMDYFLADETLIPPSLDDQFTEEVWRLPHAWMVYEPLDEAPEPNWRADAEQTLWVGSFNNLTKVREECLVLWAQVLRALPQARLLLKDARSKDSSTQQRILSVLEREGINPYRVHFTDRVSSWQEHMGQYERLDIALDPIPMTGGSTAFDALWMGVPLVTLAGDRLIGRQGAAALMGLGRPEWIACNAEDYVRIVVDLAQDVEGRRTIRAMQREQMRQSQLCDGVGMARALEDAFEQMFDRWWQEQHFQAS